jgi:transposase
MPIQEGKAASLYTGALRHRRRPTTLRAIRYRAVPRRWAFWSSKREPRIVGLQSREHHEALQAARKCQETAAFREAYAARAGIEATHGQAVRRCGSRRCRYIGLAKTHLQNIITATAVNLVRIADWVNGIPTARTRCSWFAALQKAA